VLRRSVSVGGDVDTVAAMADAMVGAAVGMSVLDARLQAWSACLNDQDTFGRDARSIPERRGWQQRRGLR